MGEQCAHRDSKVAPHGESLGIPGLCSVLELCWRSRRHGEVIRLWADITICWLAQIVLPVLLRKILHEASAAILTFWGRERAKLTRRSWRLVWGSGAEVTAVRRPRSGTDCHINTHLSEPRIRENDVKSCTFRFRVPRKYLLFLSGVAPYALEPSMKRIPDIIMAFGDASTDPAAGSVLSPIVAVDRATYGSICARVMADSSGTFYV